MVKRKEKSDIEKRKRTSFMHCTVSKIKLQERNTYTKTALGKTQRQPVDSALVKDTSWNAVFRSSIPACNFM